LLIALFRYKGRK